MLVQSQVRMAPPPARADQTGAAPRCIAACESLADAAARRQAAACLSSSARSPMRLGSGWVRAGLRLERLEAAVSYTSQSAIARAALAA